MKQEASNLTYHNLKKYRKNYQAKEVWGGIDIVINNAAIVEPIEKLGNITTELRKSIDINFLSPAIINECWEALKKVRAKLNILSGAAINPLRAGFLTV